jgi:serine/threonine protein kinase
MTTPWKPQVGDQLGHYQLKELLAVGGMGLVFRGYDPALDRPVALKVLAPELAADTQFAQQFITEARMLATLNHPNVVHVYNVGQERGLPYFAMEYVEGDNLDTLLRSVNQLNITEAVQLIRQATLGLQHAHQHRIIHGDIKPGNLVVTHQGVLKVTDFGLAHQAHITKSSDYGTPEYASPEVIEDKPSDHRSDIYALGATFYQLLAGRPPFVGDTPEAIMRQHVHDTAPPVTKYNLKVPPVLAKIIGKCLAKKPGSRYQDYPALLADLDSFRSATAAKESAKPSSVASHSLTFAALVVLALALGAYYWLTSQPTPAPPPKPPKPPATNQTKVDNPAPPTPPLPPPQPKVAEADEAAAEKVALELQQQAEPLILAGKLAEAWNVYRPWPQEPLHSATKAHQFVLEQRERVGKLARESWNRTRDDVVKLLREKNFDEAIARCDQAGQSLSLAFPDIGRLIERERDQAVRDQTAYRDQLNAAAAAAAKAVAARLAELRADTVKLVVALQWDKAQQDLRAAAEKAGGPTQAAIRELLTEEIDPLLTLRQGILNRVKTKPGPVLALTTRTSTIEGQVLATDDGRLALGHILPHGVVSTPIIWEELPAASILRFFTTCHDSTSKAEQRAQVLLLGYFALAGQARFDEARQRLQVVAQAQPEHATALTAMVTRLDEQERILQEEAVHRAATLAREQKATLAWSQVEAAVAAKDVEAANRQLTGFLQEHQDTDCAKTHQREIDQLKRLVANLPAVAPFFPIPLGTAHGITSKLVSTADHVVEDNFDGTRTFATTGYLRKLDLPAFGLPDDGNLVVRIGEQRVPFRIQTDRKQDAILLHAGGGGRIGYTLAMPGALRKPCRQLALLFAAAGGNTSLEVYPRYDNGDESVAHMFRVWNWLEQPPANNKLVGSVCSVATDRRRITLGAQVFNLEADRRLRSLRFRLADTEAARLGMNVAILGISLQSAE